MPSCVQFPFLAMLVSGGHNLLLVVRGVGDYQLLGSTIDDAVGKHPPSPPAGDLAPGGALCGESSLIEPPILPLPSRQTAVSDHRLGQCTCRQVVLVENINYCMCIACDAGEAFDKVARLLGLDASGAALEQLAREGDPRAHHFPVPMIRSPNCDFSYAGLKTSVLRCVEAQGVGEATPTNRQVPPHHLNPPSAPDLET